MIQSITKLYLQNPNKIIKCYSTQTSPTEKWDLLSAVSLERKPVVARKLNEMETKVQNYFLETELERSCKSDHEIQLITDKIKLEQLKKGDRDLDLDTIPEQSAQDFEDASAEELKNFKFADTKTEADESNNTKSNDRHLDRNLLLLVKETIGKNPVWVLPQGERQEGETLRQTAERILREKCGPELKADFFGNAPIGFYKYKYPKLSRSKSIGAKIFFFKAQFKKGNVKPDSKSLIDFQWATRKELQVLQSDYSKSVLMFLVDEEH